MIARGVIDWMYGKAGRALRLGAIVLVVASLPLDVGLIPAGGGNATLSVPRAHPESIIEARHPAFLKSEPRRGGAPLAVAASDVPAAKAAEPALCPPTPSADPAQRPAPAFPSGALERLPHATGPPTA